MLLWETILSLDAGKDGIILIARDKSAFYDSDVSTGLAPDLRDEAEHAFGRSDAVAAFYEPDKGLAEALAMVVASAERERQEEIEEQQRADEQAAERIKGLLDSDLSFLNLVAEAVDEALKYLSLGADLTAFGIAAHGIYDAYIDDVESLHNDCACVGARSLPWDDLRIAPLPRAMPAHWAAMGSSAAQRASADATGIAQAQ